jgi:3-oxoacyl-[acyl-carrier protein] reductase
MDRKTVMITGCNRGIGKEAVRLFAERGYNLICCIRKENEAFSAFITELIENNKIDADILYFDMSDEDSIKEALKPILKERRQIDVLINNAGIATGGFLQMTSMKQLKEVFQINYFSHVLITQLITKLMMRQKSGCIVNMGSVAGLDNFAGYTAYGASKAAMMSFTRTIARELAPYNIRVNAIAPGLTDTGMAGQMEEKAWKEMVARTDMNRLGKPNEIAQMMLFLASEEASFITGQVYRVDGGM